MIQGRILFLSLAVLVLVFSLGAQASLDSVPEEDVLPDSVSQSNTSMINSPANNPSIDRSSIIDQSADTSQLSNQPPKILSLVSDRECSIKAGYAVTWSAQAQDTEGDPLLYQFWINGPETGGTWMATTNWTALNSWTWRTSPADVGNSVIVVRVRDGLHSSPDDWDDLVSTEFQVDSKTSGKVPELISLRSDKQSPQPRGESIAWTTKASDADGDPVLYRFFLKGPSTDGEWVAVTPWTTKNTWAWDTKNFAAGIYYVEARVRDGYHAGHESADNFVRVSYVIRQFPN
jgi:hypothetical protein